MPNNAQHLLKSLDILMFVLLLLKFNQEFKVWTIDNKFMRGHHSYFECIVTYARRTHTHTHNIVQFLLNNLPTNRLTQEAPTEFCL